MRFAANCFFRLAVCALLVLYAAQPGLARDPRWAQPLEVEGLPNLHKVNEEVYRSAQPSRQGMRNAEALGLLTVLNLRGFHDDQGEARGTSLRLVDIPIHTGSMNEDQVIDALRAIQAGPKPVLVHCMHGADRTGTVMAFYRIIFDGWSREEAKEEMTEGGYGFHSMWGNLPRLIDSADLERIRAAVQ